ncbi:hypothetical protein HPB47_022027, partial [Ixodes persulcatus]
MAVLESTVWVPAPVSITGLVRAQTARVNAHLEGRGSTAKKTALWATSGRGASTSVPVCTAFVPPGTVLAAAILASSATNVNTRVLRVLMDLNADIAASARTTPLATQPPGFVNASLAFWERPVPILVPLEGSANTAVNDVAVPTVGFAITRLEVAAAPTVLWALLVNRCAREAGTAGTVLNLAYATATVATLERDLVGVPLDLSATGVSKVVRRGFTAQDVAYFASAPKAQNAAQQTVNASARWDGLGHYVPMKNWARTAKAVFLMVYRRHICCLL